MYECSDVDELDDHRKIDVLRVDLAGGAACEKSQKWPKPFASAAYCIENIAFQCRIKSRRLLRNARLDFFDMRLNQPRHARQRADTHRARPG